MLLVFLNLFILTYCSCVLPVSGAIYDRVEDLPSDVRWDFIIVGGGTGGLTVANRLSENQSWNVLVLEAGVSNTDVLYSEIPLLWGALIRSRYDWNTTTVPQTALNGRMIPYPRGFLLGGTSSINGEGYTRGSSEDWDRYARLTGDSGWSWASMQKYFLKNECFQTPPSSGAPTSNQYNASAHGFDGPLSVSLPRFVHPIDVLSIRASQELTDEFPFNLDTNDGNHLGIGWTQSTINAGVRSSSATAYLSPSIVSARMNLHVLLHARAARLVQTGVGAAPENKPIFRAVQFSELTQGETRPSAGATLHTVHAEKNIIVSAGTISTPILLMHSGIGPPALLSSLGIPVKVPLEGVGMNLSDQPAVPNIWRVNLTALSELGLDELGPFGVGTYDGKGGRIEGDLTFEDPARNASIRAAEEKAWFDGRKGPLADGTFSVAGWGRLRRDEEARAKELASIEGVRDGESPEAGPGTAQYEMLIQNGIGGNPIPPDGHYLFIGIAVLNPLSRGTLLPSSQDPFAPPLLDLALLTSPLDRYIMRAAMRAARRFVAARAWGGYVISGLVDQATGRPISVESDEELDTYMRGTALTVLHAVGTAAMAPRGAGYGVTDPDLVVKGTEGVRVVDASVLPLVPAGHTSVPVYAVAERVADLIKASFSA